MGAEDKPKRPPGRPRTASEANRKAGGNPILPVRLEQATYDQAQARGGAAWVRGLIERELGRL